tara:strand:+ start:629 stop:844 length:216 start_codon:yes stop_codon:yes gene_type:complete
MTWYKQANLDPGVQKGDILTYRMIPGPMGQDVVGKVIGIGPDYYEVADPSRRLLRVYPQQVVSVEKQSREL